METTLICRKKVMPGVLLGAESCWPALRQSPQSGVFPELDEDDNLFFGYGNEQCPLPHRLQDHFGRSLQDLSFDTVVLENDFLQATFLTDFGARLWSLEDKTAKRQLLHENPIFQPGNLAICNAWVAGGVEWNVGVRGHDALTCRPLFTGKLQTDDGTPVLRFYEFCRQRAIAYQMDFFLPENSRFLFARMRLLNHHERVVPMYWWSNIAVPENPGLRVVTPAEDTFTNSYSSAGQTRFCRLPLPKIEGSFDCTYPENHWKAKDLFFNIPAGQRPYIAALQADGYGLIQCSSKRLQGRKMFIWGQAQGGRNWQRSLTSPAGSDYLEIQAGLAKTQMECLPMPPKSAWEWLEAYGAMQIPAKSLHEDWKSAVKATSAELEKRLPHKELELCLQQSKNSLALKTATMIKKGSGWGALEIARLGYNPSPHLDFGNPGSEQTSWMQLLESGSLGLHPTESPPPSYLAQEDWLLLLQQAVQGPDIDNWYSWLQLGLHHYRLTGMEAAAACFERSMALCPTSWAQFAQAHIHRNRGELKQCIALLTDLLKQFYGDASLAKEVFQTCIEAEAYQELLACWQQLSPALQQIPMLQLLYASALAHTGDVDQAEAILLQDGGLIVPDLREGANSLTELYVYIKMIQAERQNVRLDLNKISIPIKLDYRMNSQAPDSFPSRG